MNRASEWLGTGGVIAALSVAAMIAQQRTAPTTIDAPARKAVIDGAIEHMQRAYIFEDVAEKMAADLRRRAANNEYDAITDPAAFAKTLTEHLQGVSRDKHLRIIFAPDGLPQRSQPTADKAIAAVERSASERK